MPASKDSCAYRDKYYNVSTEVCEPWIECQNVNEDLDTSSNKCKLVARSKEYCTDKDLFWISEEEKCQEWIVCEDELYQLDRDENVC